MKLKDIIHESSIKLDPRANIDFTSTWQGNAPLSVSVDDDDILFARYPNGYILTYGHEIGYITSEVDRDLEIEVMHYKGQLVPTGNK